MDATSLTGREFQDADGTEDWRVVGRGAAAWFEGDSHRAGAVLARTVADLAEASGQPLPELDLRARGVRVRLDRAGGRFDPATVRLAAAVSAAAREAGLRADPTVPQDLVLGIDALDRAAVMPFWQAALGYEPRGEVELVDPGRRLPPVWFQQQDAPRPLRNRLHLDIVTPQPTAAAAVEAVRARGARSVADHGYYATAADGEGNEADLLPLVEGADRWEGPATEDWRLVFAAMASYPADAGTSVTLVEAVADLADEAGLPLGVDLRPGLVTVDTGKDLWEQDEGYEPLAARVQAAARRIGLSGDVTRPRFVQVGIDAVDIGAVRGFWRAVLGYVEDPRDGITDIIDPRQLSMPFFFQPMEAEDEARRAQRNRIHVDLVVPDDQARARIAAGVAAGGRVVRDAAPEWWTLADPEGNEVDVAVSAGREELWQATDSS